MTLMLSEACDLLNRIRDGKEPDDHASGFWALMIDYGLWARQDIESARLQRATRAAHTAEHSTWNMTDDQALFIDKVVLQARKKCDENAYQVFIYCFLTSRRDSASITRFNRAYHRRCRAERVKPDDQFRADLRHAARLISAVLNCELDHIITSKKQQKNAC